jgi:hypothetical protein
LVALSLTWASSVNRVEFQFDPEIYAETGDLQAFWVSPALRGPVNGLSWLGLLAGAGCIAVGLRNQEGGTRLAHETVDLSVFESSSLVEELVNLETDLQEEAEPVIVPAPASPGAPVTQVSTPAQPRPFSAIGKPNLDPAEEMAKLNREGFARSWLVCGGAGTGKGTLLAAAQRKMKEMYGDRVRFWGIDPKNDPRELHRWTDIPIERRLHFDSNDLTLDTASVGIEICSLLQRFHAAATSDPHTIDILISDETPRIPVRFNKKFQNDYFGYIFGVATMGRSQNYGVWIGTQAVGVGSNGLTLDSRDSLQELYLATDSTIGKIITHPSYRWAKTYSSSVFEPSGRAFLLSAHPDRWQPVPAYYKDFTEDAQDLVDDSNQTDLWISNT